MTHISPAALKERLQQEDVFLLDVREPYERDAFTIGGKLMPFATILSQADSIPHNKPVIVYCQKGIRSQIAIQRLEEKFGFGNLINLQGGMEAWKRDIS